MRCQPVSRQSVFPRQSPTAYADASARVNLIKHPHNKLHLRARGGLAYLRHTFNNTPCNASRSAFFRLSAFALLRLFFGANIRSKRSVFAPKRKPATNCALLRRSAPPCLSLKTYSLLRQTYNSVIVQRQPTRIRPKNTMRECEHDRQ